MAKPKVKKVKKDKRYPLSQGEYRQNGGCSCPFCGNSDVEGGFVEVDAGTAWQKVKCNGCGKEWHDVYNLDGYETIPG